MHNACFELCCSLLQLKALYILLHPLCAHAEHCRSGETHQPWCKTNLQMHWGSVRGCSVQAVTSEVHVAVVELRLWPSAGGHCLAMQAQCGTPSDSIIQRKREAEISVSCCPPCATLLGPVLNHCHLLGYKLFPEQPFLMKDEPYGVWVYQVVCLWLGM